MWAVQVGSLIDGRGGPPMQQAVVVIEGERITQVTRAGEFVAPPEVVVWNLSHLTMLPGLIDAHVHVMASGDSDEPDWFAREVTELPGTVALNCFVNARRALQAGFTTIRDLASRHYADVALRNAINAGNVEGPRMKVCGLGLTSTAGHMDRQKAFAPGVQLPGPATIVDSPDEGRRAVRMNLRYGVDLIKINATLSELVRPLGGLYSPEMTFETMQAICELAHSHGRKVTAHCHGGIGVTWALDAGVDCLEHGRFLTDEQLEVMAKQGVFLCPTLAPETLGSPQADPTLASWLEQTRRVMYETIRRAKRAGVPIVNGSDAGFGAVTHGYGGAYEMAELVRAGLTPDEAILAATSSAAQCLDMGREVGTVEAGKLADLVLVDGDPRTDISILQDLSRIPLVLKGGEVVADRRPSEVQPPPVRSRSPRGRERPQRAAEATGQTRRR